MSVGLHVDVRGTGPRAALLHGFTQNRRCWGSFGDALAARFELALIDLPGHGISVDDDVDLDRAGELAVAAAGRASYVGYSFGGRVALHAALRDPAPFERLVLIGATGGLDTETERQARRDADEQLARRLEKYGLDAFLESWLALPLFAGIEPEQNMFVERQRNRLEGLAASLRNCGTGSQRPLWSELSALAMPVTVIAGERDHKFLAIGKRLTEAIGPNAQQHVIEGVGHACHLEDPATTATTVIAALTEAPAVPLSPDPGHRPTSETI